MPEFDAKADTATDAVASGDKFPFGDVSADGWDTIEAADLLAALVAVHPDAGGDDTLFLNGAGGFTAPAGGGGGGGAPTDATYLTLGTNGTLSKERVLTEGTGIDFVDAGAGSTLTVRIDPTYAGQNTITTLGTVATGVWKGTAVATGYGGLGADNSAATGVPVFSAGAVTITGTTGTGAPVLATSPTVRDALYLYPTGKSAGLEIYPDDTGTFGQSFTLAGGGTAVFGSLSSAGALALNAFSTPPAALLDLAPAANTTPGLRFKGASGQTALPIDVRTNADATVFSVSAAGAAVAASYNGVTVTNGGSGALTVTGTASVSGANTGDQFTSVTASRLLGRGSSGAGAAQEITLGSGLSMSGTTLSVSAGGGNVSTSGSPTTGDYARWASASTIESRTAAQVRGDIGLGATDSVTFDQVTATYFGFGGNLTDLDPTQLSAPVPTGFGGFGTDVSGANGIPVFAVGVPTVTTNPTVATLEVGNATDATISRAGAGDIAVEGNIVYRAGGTDVPVTDGGTGRSTGTTAYCLVATGTTATGAQQTLGSGATTDLLVGGGASALPVWTAATGTGSPVRATSPALVTPALGTPSSGTLTNCTGLPVGGISATGTPSSSTYLRGDGTWATPAGGGGSGDMVAALVNAEVSVTGATTLTASAFGKWHVCSGTTADYTVGLPAASGNAGKFIGFRMSAALTKLVTLDGNGSETIDGATTRVMWAQESCVLLCDGSNWTKVAGRGRAFSAELAATAAQNLTTSGYNQLTLPTTVADTGSLSTGSNALTVRRAGDYRVSVYCPVDCLAANFPIVTEVWVGGAAYRRVFRGGSDAGNIGGGASTMRMPFAAGDVVTAYTYSSGSYKTEYSAGQNAARLQLTEDVPW